MKKRILFITLFSLVLCFVACNKGENADKNIDENVNDKKEYYKNTTLEKLETFTNVTGIELNVEQDDEENGAIIYNYMLDNDANGNGAVYKYETYLSKYGFVKNEEYSVGGVNAYVKDEYALMTTCAEIKDNILQYVIIIPKDKNYNLNSENKTSTSDDSEIEHLKVLVKEKKYKEAVDYYNNSNLRKNHFDNNDEVKKYFFYAEANAYLEDGCYGTSYELLEEYCSGFLNSDTIIKDIYDTVGPLNGVYENISVGYSGMYICVRNGKVACEIPLNGLESSVYYSYDLSKYTFTTGETAFGIGTAVLKETDYILQPLDNGNVFVGAAEGNPYKTFSGVYEKRNLPLPEKK